jgi:group I intron endonuclease
MYRWTNKINSKFYVGSSVNLAARFRQYFNLSYIQKNNLVISRALISYGYQNFNLEILEYCDSNSLLS